MPPGQPPADRVEEHGEHQGEEGRGDDLVDRSQTGEHDDGGRRPQQEPQTSGQGLTHTCRHRVDSREPEPGTAHPTQVIGPAPSVGLGLTRCG